MHIYAFLKMYKYAFRRVPLQIGFRKILHYFSTYHIAAYAAYAEHDDTRPTFMEYTQTTNDLFTFSDGNIKINQCAIKIANLLRLGKKNRE